jgi:integrase
MASVSERGGRWYVRYRDASGKWVRQVSTADSKTAARRLAAELERRAERQRLGLEEGIPPDGGGALSDLFRWWLESYSKPRPSHARNVYSVTKHFIGGPLGELRLVDVTSGRLEEFLQAKSASLSPQTVNHLRRFVQTAFNRAKRAGRWAGSNPAANVQARRVSRRAHDYLRAQEVLPLLRALDPRWQPLFAVAIYTGLRRGELLGLRKTDVDLSNGLVTVARSYNRETTKGGHADTIPVPSEVLPWLAEAIRASPSELVFPHVCATTCAHQQQCPGPGGMMRTDTALESVLRRAMGRAEIAERWKHVCRRRGCGHHEEAQDGAPRRCPKCKMKLWPKPQPRPLRFHDLRHTTASLLFMAGADAVAVQKLMRHRDLRMTIGTYGHLSPGYMRGEVDRLRFLPDAPISDEALEELPALASGENPASLGPTLVQEGAGKDKAPRPEEVNPVEAWALVQARSTGLEPVTSGVTGRRSNQLN